MFDSSLFQCLIPAISNDYPQLYCYNAGADDLSAVSTAAYFNDLLYRVKTGDKVMITTDTSGLSFSATFRNDGTNVSLDFDRMIWLQGEITDVSGGASSSFICAPAGIITEIGGALDTAITVANAVITLKLAGTTVTGSTLTFTPAMAAGTSVTADPSALNILSSAGVIEIASAGGSTTTSRGNFFVKMICPAQI